MTNPIDPATATLPIDAADWSSDWDDSDDSGGIAAQPSATVAAGTVGTLPLRGAGGLNPLADFAQARLVAVIEDARNSLVGQVRGLKSVADLFTGLLGNTAPPVAKLVDDAAGTIDMIADRLAEKSALELVDDGRALVRAQPAAAVGLAIAIGFLAGRFLKAARD